MPAESPHTQRGGSSLPGHPCSVGISGLPLRFLCHAAPTAPHFHSPPHQSTSHWKLSFVNITIILILQINIVDEINTKNISTDFAFFFLFFSSSYDRQYSKVSVHRIFIADNSDIFSILSADDFDFKNLLLSFLFQFVFLSDSSFVNKIERKSKYETDEIVCEIRRIIDLISRYYYR